MSKKMWGGRFAESTHRAVEAFTASIDVDRRLYAFDIEGSIAHCRMLAETGIIAAEEADQMIEGLGRIRREIERGELPFHDSLEDIHMHVEDRLFQIVGKVARKLHTARSRNDQVALDTRLYLRHETDAVLAGLRRLRRVLVDLAREQREVILPGYTHLQRAQPVLLAHHLLAYYEMFGRDAARFAEGRRRINVLPLGSAALAGTTYPIDRHRTAELLGFEEVSGNSLDAVADRDFIMEFLGSASICMLHFSRLAEELVLWSSAEFGFVELPDAFATGSSIMPQKKNPDVPELVRGKAGSVIGALVAVFTTMKALPLAYNRDMQEDKAPLFQAVDTLKACIHVVSEMLPRVAFKRERMLAATETGGLSATDLADYLVGKGLAFRDAHDCVGRAVGWALEQGRELPQLSLGELKTFSDKIEEDVFEFLATPRMIERRASYGGTSSANVLAALERAEVELAGEGGP
jgi:argininosuccinate lyase